MKQIQCNLRQLVERKAMAEDRRITYQVIHDETGGVNNNALTQLMNNRWALLSKVNLERLLTWLDCDLSDLFSVVEEAPVNE